MPPQAVVLSGMPRRIRASDLSGYYDASAGSCFVRLPRCTRASDCLGIVMPPQADVC